MANKITNAEHYERRIGWSMKEEFILIQRHTTQNVLPIDRWYNQLVKVWDKTIIM